MKFLFVLMLSLTMGCSDKLGLEIMNYDKSNIVEIASLPDGGSLIIEIENVNRNEKFFIMLDYRLDSNSKGHLLLLDEKQELVKVLDKNSQEERETLEFVERWQADNCLNNEGGSIFCVGILEFFDKFGKNDK